MNIFNISALLILVLFAACSTKSEPGKNDPPAQSRIFDYKAPPREAPKLEIPPELTSYTSDDRYAIPGEGDTGTRFSDYQQGSAGKKAGNVIPVVRNVRMDGGCNQRWLVVNDKPENVWPLIRSFWEDNGLSISNDNQQAGIMESEWQENLAKLPKDTLRGYLGQYISSVQSTGERDKYRTRMQRSKDGNSLEIYISHSGLKAVQNKDETGYSWIDRPSDPELEATMLQLLMSKLGGGAGVLDSSRKAEKNGDKATFIPPKLKKLDNGSQIIQLAESFDKSWRKVGLALDQSGFVLADKDRSKGIYFLSTGKEEPKAKQETEKVQRMQVLVKEAGSGCEVSVNTSSGNSEASSQKVVETLFRALGKL